MLKQYLALHILNWADHCLKQKNNKIINQTKLIKDELGRAIIK